MNIKTDHLSLAREVIGLMWDEMESTEGVYTFAVGGESGSGKTTLSLAIKSALGERGKQSFIFHMDDYFYLPPGDTYNKRLRDISTVGPGEVNMELLQEHLDSVRSGVSLLKKPLVSYRENQIYEVIAETENTEVIIAEGTYALLLNNIDCRIFMQRNYMETYENRVMRARDPVIPFYEKVLEIEHNIVKEHAELADILIDKNYNVKVKSEEYKESDYS